MWEALAQSHGLVLWGKAMGGGVLTTMCSQQLRPLSLNTFMTLFGSQEAAGYH